MGEAALHAGAWPDVGLGDQALAVIAPAFKDLGEGLDLGRERRYRRAGAARGVEAVLRGIEAREDRAHRGDRPGRDGGGVVEPGRALERPGEACALRCARDDVFEDIQAQGIDHHEKEVVAAGARKLVLRFARKGGDEHREPGGHDGAGCHACAASNPFGQSQSESRSKNGAVEHQRLGRERPGRQIAVGGESERRRQGSEDPGPPRAHAESLEQTDPAEVGAGADDQRHDGPPRDLRSRQDVLSALDDRRKVEQRSGHGEARAGSAVRCGEELQCSPRQRGEECTGEEVGQDRAGIDAEQVPHGPTHEDEIETQHAGARQGTEKTGANHPADGTRLLWRHAASLAQRRGHLRPKKRRAASSAGRIRSDGRRVGGALPGRESPCSGDTGP